MNTFAIVDLETTGSSSHKGDRIIEIAIVIYHNGEIIKTYNQLLDPEQHISRFITYLTGITNEMVTGKPTFKDIAHEISTYFKDAYFVAHNVPFDLGFLNDELSRHGLDIIKQPVIDTVELSRILLPQAPSFKLSDLSEWLVFKHQNPHRALSDAYVTTELLDYLLNKISLLPHATIEHLLNLASDLHSNLKLILMDQKQYLEDKNILNNGYGYQFQLAYKAFIEPPDQVGEIGHSFGSLLDHLFSNDSPLKEVFKAFETRPGQREMAESTFHAFQSEQHAIIEAGAGIGKSLSFLIAASYHAVKNNERVIISTYLNQLQEQLVNEDWKRLKEVLPFECHVTVLKGKTHYLNLALFSQALKTKSENYEQVLTKAILLIWLTETDTGDLDEVQLPSSGYRFVKRISARNESKLMLNQRNTGSSYYELAKSRAKQADLLVINHSLLANSLRRESDLLSINDKFILDEAHHLEGVVSNQNGLRLDYTRFHQILRALAKFIDQLSLMLGQRKDKLTRAMGLLLEENERFFRYIYRLVNHDVKRDTTESALGRKQYMVETNNNRWINVIDMAYRLELNMDKVSQLLDDMMVLNFDLTKKDHFVKELDELKQTIRAYFDKTTFHTSVNWFETDRVGQQINVYLYKQPIDTAQFLKANFFDQFDSIVMTSASLSVNDNFLFFKEQLHLQDQKLIEQQIPSPYHFHEQVKLLIPNDFPKAVYGDMDPFVEAASEAILSLAEITEGRMLILFNSNDLLKKTYHILSEFFNDDYLLIAQGISSGSPERLKKNFQSMERSILLGTHTFWEGLDIPGQDLSCVVIVRLPFDSPSHPVIHQKHQLIKQEGENPFTKLSLPTAVMRFKQGFGRLIRSKTDRGIIFVCDDRLMTKSYGQAFLDSIPAVPVHHKSTYELINITNNWL